MSNSRTIIRRPDRAEGGLTDADHAAMADHVNLWTARAFRTAPIEVGEIVPAIHALYAAAGLKLPRVVVVPSPFVMAMAGGIASAVWHLRKEGKAPRAPMGFYTDGDTRNAVDSAAFSATLRATRGALDHATDSPAFTATFRAAAYGATRAATHSGHHNVIEDATTSAVADVATEVATRSPALTATHDAIDFVTRAAVLTATLDATDDALAATFEATYDATHAATEAARAAMISATLAAATQRATFNATRNAAIVATFNALDADTESPTHDATEVATKAALDDATLSDTYAATNASTHDATRMASWLAVHNGTYDAIGTTIRVATPDSMPWRKLVAEFVGDENYKLALSCIARWSAVYQGGNMWAGWDAYLTATRDILGLRLPQHEAYAAWEKAAIHGGFRFMHDEFCLVVDFPEFIHVDGANRPHCADGPSHRWRDGWSLYHWHGVVVPSEWIENRPSLTPTVALTQTNIELRRAACEIIGWENILQQLGSTMIDEDEDPEIGTLVEVTLEGIRERFLRVRCGTGRMFALPVPSDMQTALAASAWTYAYDADKFTKPEVRT